MKSESRIQQEIFEYYWNRYCLPSNIIREIIFHVPNEGKENGKLVPIGLYPGASDLIISYKGKIIFIEVKTPEGKHTKNQIKFSKHIRASGFDYHICKSLIEFKQLLEYS